MASRVRRICGYRPCSKVFHPRLADVLRGWGKFHNKSCKAKEQEARTGQYADLLARPTEYELNQMALADAESDF